MAGKLSSPSDSSRLLLLPVFVSLLVLTLVGHGVYQSHKITALEDRVTDVERTHVQKRSVADSELDRLVEEHFQRQLKTRQLQAHGLEQFVKDLLKTETHLLESYCSNSSILCLPGQKGDSGAKGQPGATGIHGPSGLRGHKGEAGGGGAAGRLGPKGDAGIHGLRGPKGDQGRLGQNRYAGPKGDKGDRGVQGATGTSGPPGPKGDRGGGDGTGPILQECCVKLSYPKYQGAPTEVVHAVEGQEVILPCKSMGYPPPVITWTIGTLLARARYTEITDGLNIHGVRRSDDDKVFECVIGNIFGTTKKHIRLVVTAPLSVNVTPSSPTFEEGHAGDIKLHCRYNGFPQPTITWLHRLANGQTAILNTNVDDTASGMSTLTIHNPIVTDAGLYTCRASNSVESLKSSTTLVVLGPPHITPPENQTVMVGSMFTIRCNVTGDPMPSLTWIFPHGQHQPRFNVHINLNNSLTATGADNHNEGTYTCIAQNRYGSRQMKANIQIVNVVAVTLTPTNSSLQGPYVSLECRASGDPTPNITWSKVEGTIVKTDARHIILGGDLVISGITPATKNKDSGIYECTASNGQSTVKKQAIVYKEINSINCNTTFQICAGTPGVACGVTCPAGCAAHPGLIFGYKDYTANSLLCQAGIQTGVISDAGGLVTWVMRDGSFLTFLGKTHNGITSSATGPIHAAATVFQP